MSFSASAPQEKEFEAQGGLKLGALKARHLMMVTQSPLLDSPFAG